MVSTGGLLGHCQLERARALAWSIRRSLWSSLMLKVQRPCGKGESTGIFIRHSDESCSIMLIPDPG